MNYTFEEAAAKRYTFEEATGKPPTRDSAEVTFPLPTEQERLMAGVPVEAVMPKLNPALLAGAEDRMSLEQLRNNPPSVLGAASPSEDVRGMAANINRASGSVLQGLASIVDNTLMIDPDTGDVIPGMEEENQRRISRTPSERMKDLRASPLYKAGQYVSETGRQMEESIPEYARQDPIFKTAKEVGGFAPLAVAAATTGGVGGLSTIALQTAGDHISNDYETNLASGMSEDEAARKAFNTAYMAGGAQALVFGVLPKPLQKLGDKFLLERVGTEGVKRFLANRIAQGGEGAALGAASRIAENAVSGRNLGEGVAESAEALGVLQAIFPRALTEREQKGIMEDWIAKRKAIAEWRDKLSPEVADHIDELSSRLGLEIQMDKGNEPYWEQNPGGYMVLLPNGKAAIHPGRMMERVIEAGKGGKASAEAVRSTVFEEAFHMFERSVKTVDVNGEPMDTKQAWLASTSKAERAIWRRIHTGEWGKKTEYGSEWTDEQLASEAIAYRIGKLIGETPQSLIGLVGREKWTVKSLDLMEQIIRQTYGRMGSRRAPGKAIDALIQDIAENIGITKKFIAAGSPTSQQEQDKFLSENVPFSTKRKDTGTPDMFSMDERQQQAEESSKAKLAGKQSTAATEGFLMANQAIKGGGEAVDKYMRNAEIADTWKYGTPPERKGEISPSGAKAKDRQENESENGDGSGFTPVDDVLYWAQSYKMARWPENEVRKLTNDAAIISGLTDEQMREVQDTLSEWYGAEKPSAEKPSAEKPSAEKPSAEKPSAEKPNATIDSSSYEFPFSTARKAASPEEQRRAFTANIIGLQDEAKRLREAGDEAGASELESQAKWLREKMPEPSKATEGELRDNIGTTVIGMREEAKRLRESGDEAGAKEMEDQAEWLKSKMPPFQFATIRKSQTDTPEFKRWFGDSKVVDSEGKPLVVNHTTNTRSIVGSEGEGADWKAIWENNPINIFRAGQAHFGTREQAEQHMYGSGKATFELEPATYPVYLSIQNPKRIKDAKGSWISEIEKAKSEGYDGIVYRNEYEPNIPIDDITLNWEKYREESNSVRDADKLSEGALYARLLSRDQYWAAKRNMAIKEGHTADSYLPFYPEQIKSAIGNRGTFDPTNPDIRYATVRKSGVTQYPSNAEDRYFQEGLGLSFPQREEAKAKAAEERAQGRPTLPMKALPDESKRYFEEQKDWTLEGFAGNLQSKFGPGLTPEKVNDLWKDSVRSRLESASGSELQSLLKKYGLEAKALGARRPGEEMPSIPDVAAADTTELVRKRARILDSAKRQMEKAERLEAEAAAAEQSLKGAEGVASKMGSEYFSAQQVKVPTREMRTYKIAGAQSKSEIDQMTQDIWLMRATANEARRNSKFLEQFARDLNDPRKARGLFETKSKEDKSPDQKRRNHVIAVLDEHFTGNMEQSRHTGPIGIDDVDWFEGDTAWRQVQGNVINPETLPLELVKGAGADRSTHITRQETSKGRETFGRKKAEAKPSTTRRVTVVQDKVTGKVYALSTYRDPKLGVVVRDPRISSKREFSSPLSSMLERYNVLDSLLLGKPVEHYLHMWESLGAYLKDIGNEGRTRSNALKSEGRDPSVIGHLRDLWMSRKYVGGSEELAKAEAGIPEGSEGVEGSYVVGPNADLVRAILGDSRTSPTKDLTPAESEAAYRVFRLVGSQQDIASYIKSLYEARDKYDYQMSLIAAIAEEHPKKAAKLLGPAFEARPPEQPPGYMVLSAMRKVYETIKQSDIASLAVKLEAESAAKGKEVDPRTLMKMAEAQYQPNAESLNERTLNELYNFAKDSESLGQFVSSTTKRYARPAEQATLGAQFGSRDIPDYFKKEPNQAAEFPSPAPAGQPASIQRGGVYVRPPPTKGELRKITGPKKEGVVKQAFDISAKQKSALAEGAEAARELEFSNLRRKSQEREAKAEANAAKLKAKTKFTPQWATARRPVVKNGLEKIAFEAGYVRGIARMSNFLARRDSESHIAGMLDGVTNGARIAGRNAGESVRLVTADASNNFRGDEKIMAAADAVIASEAVMARFELPPEGEARKSELMQDHPDYERSVQLLNSETPRLREQGRAMMNRIDALAIRDLREDGWIRTTAKNNNQLELFDEPKPVTVVMGYEFNDAALSKMDGFLQQLQVGREKAQKLMKMSEGKPMRLRMRMQQKSKQWLEEIARQEANVLYAKNNWANPKLRETAIAAKKAMDEQWQREYDAGYHLAYDQNYIPNRWDAEFIGDNMVSFGERRVLGMRFNRPRKFQNKYEALSVDAYLPVLKNISDSVEHRVQQGMMKIHQSQWNEALKSMSHPTFGKAAFTDPVQGMPVMDAETGLPKRNKDTGEIIRRGSEFYPPSSDYELRYPISQSGKVKGRPIAVHRDYVKFYDMLTRPSAIHDWSVSRGALKFSQASKHLILLADLFHLGRVAYYGTSLLGRKMGYEPALSVLEYDLNGIERAEQVGAITPEQKQWALGRVPVNFGGTPSTMTRWELSREMVRHGLNVGRIRDALYMELVEKVPFIGKASYKYNRWLFDKFTRGVMMNTALTQFERLSKSNPNLDSIALVRDINRDVNVFFGSIGKQGWFKSDSVQDFFRIFGLAPQWVEGLVKKEASFVGRVTGMGKAMGYRRGMPNLGVAGKGMTNLLAAGFVITQALNLITRGKPTWMNEEDGHRLDAWIPDPTGQTRGFWFSALAPGMEITHDINRYLNTKGDVRETLAQIGENKLNNLGRMLVTLGTGTTPTGIHTTSAGSWIKETAKAGTPSPIAGSLLAEGAQTLAPGVLGKPQPGALIRRAAGTFLGQKIESMESAATQMRNLARNWVKSEGLDKEVGWKSVPTDEASYSKLSRACRQQDYREAGKLLQSLMRNRSMKDVYSAMWNRSKGPWTNSEQLEPLFVSSLTDSQFEVYGKAFQERQDDWNAFLDFMAVAPVQ